MIALIAILAVSSFPPSSGADVPAGIWQDSSVSRAVVPVTGGEVKCINGKAKIYDCRNVDLLSSLPPPVIGGKAPMVLFGFTEIINDM